VGVSDDEQPTRRGDADDEVPALPEHLSVLVASLHGPADLGRNHDKYLTYTDRDHADGAASA
jgi:hypothetical protein